jgi:hypothetical protein
LRCVHLTFGLRIGCLHVVLVEVESCVDRYEFMFSLLPLILERGTASPANPVALF